MSHKWDLNVSANFDLKKPVVKRNAFIAGVRHVMKDGKWYMQYAARYGRYKFLNFFSGQSSKRCGILPKDRNFIPKQSMTSGVTAGYLTKFRNSVGQRVYPSGNTEFYDLHTDPFELINLSKK